MWIVRLALRRPYTFTVMAILLIVLSVLTFIKMPKDIFPDIDIPVVSVIWSYGGLPAQEMERRIVTISERAMTTTVNDIEHIESQSFEGVTVIKVFFQPHAKIEAAVAQVTAINQTILRVFPPGTTPPLVLRYSASNVPILQLSLEGKKLTEQDLFDLGLNFIRTQLATVQGASIPLPLGGKQRQIMVDLDPNALQAKKVSPSEVSTAINGQNVILPSGSIKIGETEFKVLANNSPDVIDSLNNIPIKQVNGTTIYLRDVAHVRDGFAVQTNLVRSNGTKSTLLTILKSGGASTLDVIARVKKQLPKIAATLPPELEMKPLFDQSIFVRSALEGVEHEAMIAACLTAAMIMLFLGSWRSTLIVATSIPLSISCSILAMAAMGQTINIMTLGGLALAVGILVDDTTVEIENIHRNLAMGKTMVQAILDGAEQIAGPAFVSTICICIVFIPIFFLGGVAYFLFAPMAMAVVFAMMASYFLSRTIVPTMARFLLEDEPEGHQEAHSDKPQPVPTNIFAKIHYHFNHHFENVREGYVEKLHWFLDYSKTMIVILLLVVIVSLAGLVPFLGRDFFPLVDAGQFRLHVRGPAGLRLEETQNLFNKVHEVIREVVPEKELSLILDNIGLPASGINLAFTDSAAIGPFDGEILVALDKEKHGPTWTYLREIRKRLNRQFPDCTFYTQPADIVGQILNFGLPAPIDIQVVGRDPKNIEVALQLVERVSQVSGAVDVHLHQVVKAPALYVNVDRERAKQIGLTQRDIISDLLISLSSSGQTAPNYWINPKNGVNYSIVVQTPQSELTSIDQMQQTPIGADKLIQSQLLGNLAEIKRTTTPAVVSHYNVQPTLDVYSNIQGRDLGGVADDIGKIIKEMEKNLPRGTSITVRGQVESMNQAYLGLGFGILAAIILIYFLLVINFQSWLDPFIIIMALPGALTGIAWMLFLTHTPLSVPALMGTIMSLGVATANSILMITFANEQRLEGLNAFDAALQAGHTRLRPVLMTALAMIIGMFPMSLGFGEGGEQNAPLGRAVIGGLIIATFFTLFFVPAVYNLLRQKAPHVEHDPLLEEPHSHSHFPQKETPTPTTPTSAPTNDALQSP
ncbi:MAG: efflux RND transporter permease subunit [Verrucomicrobiota bacterium]